LAKQKLSYNSNQCRTLQNLTLINYQNLTINLKIKNMTDCSIYPEGSQAWIQCNANNERKPKRMPFYGVLKSLVEKRFGKNCEVELGMNRVTNEGIVKQFEVYGALSVNDNPHLFIARTNSSTPYRFITHIPGIRNIVFDRSLPASGYDARTSTYTAKCFEDFFNFIENRK
jgi:hypothetical protein